MVLARAGRFLMIGIDKAIMDLGGASKQFRKICPNASSTAQAITAMQPWQLGSSINSSKC